MGTLLTLDIVCQDDLIHQTPGSELVDCNFGKLFAQGTDAFILFMDLDDHIKQFGALADKSRIIVNLKIQMDGIGMGIALLIDGFILLRGLITKLIKRFIGHHNHLTAKLAYLK